MARSLHGHRLPGIGPERLRKLEAAGLDSLEALAATGSDAAPVPGVPATIVRRAAEEARRLLADDLGDDLTEEPTGEVPADAGRVLPFTRPVEADDPAEDAEDRLQPTRRLARGLKTARALERSADLARRARAHCKQAGASEIRSWVRKQLARVLTAIEELQQAVIALGISSSGNRELRAALDPLDATLERLLANKPKRRRMEKVGRVAKAARKRLS